MKVAAIIAEYDPLHNGHLKHIQTVKQLCDAVVIIMSGHLMQRGELATFDKWTRTKAALLSGADLILEIPSVFSCSSAEKFAHSAIKIVKELNFINFISFGSEIGNISKLKEVAKICQTIDKTTSMKYFLKQGFNYPTARSKAIKINSNLLNFPNNILAVEYIKASLNLKCKLNFHTIKRTDVQHNSNYQNNIASSKYIREHLDQIKNFVPKQVLNLYKNNNINFIKEYLFFNLRLKSLSSFKKLPDISEGLENRLFKASKLATNLNEFFNLVKCKRYTMSRIKRLTIYSLLNIEKNKLTNLPTYSRILGFNSTGRKLINLIKPNRNFLFSTNFKKIEQFNFYSANIDSAATDLINLFHNQPKPCLLEFKNKPIILF